MGLNWIRFPLMATLAAFPAIEANTACLEKNNDREHLSLKEVYQNGRLKLRIDGVKSVGKEMFVEVRSNSKMLSKRWDVEIPDFVFGGIATDICRGIEVSFSCTFVFSEQRGFFVSLASFEGRTSKKRDGTVFEAAVLLQGGTSCRN